MSLSSQRYELSKFDVKVFLDHAQIIKSLLSVYVKFCYRLDYISLFFLVLFCFVVVVSLEMSLLCVLNVLSKIVLTEGQTERKGILAIKIIFSF